MLRTSVVGEDPRGREIARESRWEDVLQTFIVGGSDGGVARALGVETDGPAVAWVRIRRGDGEEGSGEGYPSAAELDVERFESDDGFVSWAYHKLAVEFEIVNEDHRPLRCWWINGRSASKMGEVLPGESWRRVPPLAREAPALSACTPTRLWAQAQLLPLPRVVLLAKRDRRPHLGQGRGAGALHARRRRSAPAGLPAAAGGGQAKVRRAARHGRGGASDALLSPLIGNCDSWARNGQCSRNRGFMDEGCMRACGGCEAWAWAYEAGLGALHGVLQQRGVRSLAELKGLSGQQLEALRRDAAAAAPAAAKQLEELSDKLTRRRRVAALAQSGHAGQGACADKRPECESWAERGECDTNSGFMSLNCARACGVCREEEPKAADEGGGGEGSEHCGEWAAAGECERNPSWMRENCAASCGGCGEGGGGQASEHCARWAATGECERNPGWMRENCAASCGIGCAASRKAGGAKDEL